MQDLNPDYQIIQIRTKASNLNQKSDPGFESRLSDNPDNQDNLNQKVIQDSNPYYQIIWIQICHILYNLERSFHMQHLPRQWY